MFSTLAMGKPLCDFTVYQVVTLRGLNLSWQGICDKLGLKNRHVATSAYRRIQKNGSYKTGNSTGRWKKIDAGMERKLIYEVQNNPKTSAETMRVMWNSFSTTNGVSAKTIGRYTASEADQLQKLAMRPKTALNRIRWGKQRKTWSVAGWKRILFTDEVTFRLFSDGRVTEWRRSGKRFDPSCVVSKNTNKRSMML